MKFAIAYCKKWEMYTRYIHTYITYKTKFIKKAEKQGNIPKLTLHFILSPQQVVKLQLSLLRLQILCQPSHMLQKSWAMPYLWQRTGRQERFTCRKPSRTACTISTVSSNKYNLVRKFSDATQSRILPPKDQGKIALSLRCRRCRSKPFEADFRYHHRA